MGIVVKGKFVELSTFEDNKRILMRVDHISSCSELHLPGTSVGLLSGEIVHVRESYDEIRSLLEKEA